MFPTQLALGLLAATTASAGQLAAWWTNDFGPALIMQDDASAGLRYSLCNSRGVPIFPNDTSITLPLLTSPPKNGTALTAGGWWDTKDIWVRLGSSATALHLRRLTLIVRYRPPSST